MLLDVGDLRHDPRVVDEYIDVPEPPADLVGRLLGAGGRVHVEPHELRRGAVGAEFLGDAERIICESATDLRAAAGRHPDDPGIRQLVADLSAASEHFAELWSAGEVRVQRSSVRRIRHPVVGHLELDAQTLQVSCADQRLVFYTAAPGTPSHEVLQLLRVVGVQDLATKSASRP